MDLEPTVSSHNKTRRAMRRAFYVAVGCGITSS
jgi:hypothetical protein